MINHDFTPYKGNKEVFFETGTYLGHGVDNSIRSGFKEIFSMEIDPELFYGIHKKHRENKNIHIIFGDSSTMLFSNIEQINEPIFFWLDGHYSGDGTGQSPNLQTWEMPLLLEIQQIAQHPIKNHTILIDDLRCIGGAEAQRLAGHKTIFTEETLKHEILKINPAYQFRYIDGYVKNDILMAYVDEL